MRFAVLFLVSMFSGGIVSFIVLTLSFLLKINLVIIFNELTKEFNLKLMLTKNTNKIKIINM